MKYYCSTRDDCSGIDIKAYDESKGIRKIGHCTIIYHNTLWINELFDTIEEAIKSLGGYRQPCTLPNGKTIRPVEVNYPGLDDGILQRVYFPITETVCDPRL